MRTMENENREYILRVYGALQEKGYNAVGQIVGYLLTEDPTYITNHNNARTLIRKIDRDEPVAGAGPQIFGAVTVFLCIPPQRWASVRMARRPSLREFFCVQGPKAGLFPGIGCNFL